jgi:hypothetical protein
VRLTHPVMVTHQVRHPAGLTEPQPRLGTDLPPPLPDPRPAGPPPLPDSRPAGPPPLPDPLPSPPATAAVPRADTRPAAPAPAGAPPAGPVRARPPRPGSRAAASHAGGSRAGGPRSGAAGSRRRRPSLAGRQRLGAAYLVLVCGVALSLAYMWRGPQNVRGGTLAMAGMLLAAAGARLILPERSAGMLASRRRLADVAAFIALGVALLVAGLVFPAQN